MNPNPQPASSLLVELEQVERALRALKECEGTFGARRDTLMQYLEVVTRPAPIAAPAPVRRHSKGYMFKGAHEPCRFDIDIYTGILEALWTAYPDRREAMAAAAARCGNYRPYVARTPTVLFPNYPAHRAYRFSRRLVEGWFVDTNMNSTRMARILPPLVAAAGLIWGKDVAVFWHDEPAVALNRVHAG